MNAFSVPVSRPRSDSEETEPQLTIIGFGWIAEHNREVKIATAVLHLICLLPWANDNWGCEGETEEFP
jgi:hypothetical protein